MPRQAEPLLRRASRCQGDEGRKIRPERPALVLDLQGKYDEARKVAMQDAAPEAAKADSDLMRSIVRLDPKAVTAPAGGPAEVQLARAPSPKAAPRSAKTPAKGAPWQVQVAETSDPVPEPSTPLKPSAD